VGKNKVWFYLGIALFVLACCCAIAIYRYYRGKDQPPVDKRSPYEVWVDYHDAKRDGKDFVPQAHVINPVSPSAALPGHESRLLSMRLVKDLFASVSTGTGSFGGGPTDGKYGGTRRLDPSSIYDSSGGQRNNRISHIELNDLYGRQSNEPYNLQGLRALDKMAEESNNPADLRGVTDDEVAAATAMVSCQSATTFSYLLPSIHPNKHTHNTLSHTHIPLLSFPSPHLTSTQFRLWLKNRYSQQALSRK
jgi:hypothetical protein